MKTQTWEKTRDLVSSMAQNLTETAMIGWWRQPRFQSWLSVADVFGLTPLDRVLQAGRSDLATLMIEREQQDLTASQRAITPLHRASILGMTDVMAILLRLGANPETRDGLGETPLHKCARAGDSAGMRLLLQWADPEPVSRDGLTPLHWACLLGREDIAVLLVQAGADPWHAATYANGETPADFARVTRQEMLLDMMISA
ncbi:MAG TPA: ankyrin repeat domain-containing protein [Candidatus Hydrogenedentes bacterium]|nr:ankyrin repeat domain-containing protein [Candidatus Hydrogenedentota bacterium]HOJ68413.1 ankyrin repeat domain-containing protein [Candidatus Hydrogenedentota bacterium]HOK90166.1 ankyrin repeat domain-containing protein [Candidatus Hydrogenedentota bacterium]HOV59562.1 ankyrin repeat domain-containing protein [Candidatus Hydrogenedentota bacterium]HPO30065.1 ankyrin repeat domain-containing protein [Candidatus Hydrogenedentota bacterium]